MMAALSNKTKRKTEFDGSYTEKTNKQFCYKIVQVLFQIIHSNFGVQYGLLIYLVHMVAVMMCIITLKPERLNNMKRISNVRHFDI